MEMGCVVCRKGRAITLSFAYPIPSSVRSFNFIFPLVVSGGEFLSFLLSLEDLSGLDPLIECKLTQVTSYSES